MTSPITRKRSRVVSKTRVADMTTDELKKMIESLVEHKIKRMLQDPDAGLALRPMIAQSLLRQEQQFAAGKRGKPLAKVAKQLGLD